MHLHNNTKIAFCNAYDAIERHSGICSDCARYLRNGDGDLCNWAKEAIAMHLAYADTSLQPARAAEAYADELTELDAAKDQAREALNIGIPPNEAARRRH